MSKPWFDGAFINYTCFAIVSAFITLHSHAIFTNPLRLQTFKCFKTKPKIRKCARFGIVKTFGHRGKPIGIKHVRIGRICSHGSYLAEMSFTVHITHTVDLLLLRRLIKITLLFCIFCYSFMHMFICRLICSRFLVFPFFLICRCFLSIFEWIEAVAVD